VTIALTDLDILRELEPVAEHNLDEHLREARNPHDYVPWTTAGMSPRWVEWIGSRDNRCSPRSRARRW